MNHIAVSIYGHLLSSMSIAFLLFLFLFGPAAAAVKCVDDNNTTATKNGTLQYPYASIQAAINAAASGDTVKVAAGTYNESIIVSTWESQKNNFKLLGGYAGAGSTAYAAGSGGDFTSRDPEANVSKIIGSKGANTVDVADATHFKIDGFTITGGNIGVHMQWGLAYDTVSNNIIEHNGDFITGWSERDGAGIFVDVGAHDCILNNIIRNNTTPGRGAGIFCDQDTGFLIKGNTVEDNIVYSDHGAGCFIGDGGTLTGNIIQRNGFDAAATYGWGPGIYMLGRDTLSYSIIRDNYTPGVYSGVYVDEGAHAVIHHCLVYHNNTGSGNGAGICVDEAAASVSGGLTGTTWAWVTNCTVANNNMGSRGWGNGIYCDLSFVSVKNSIFWGNGGSNNLYPTADDGTPHDSIPKITAQYCLLQSPPTQTGLINGYLSVAAQWSLIQQTYGGTGNFIADPLFADTANADFHLKAAYGRWKPATSSWVNDAVTSPAINTGDPASDYSLEPAPNGGRINLGAYGGTAEASKSGSTEIGSGDLNWIAKSMFKVSCSPNPCNSSTVIYYQLPVQARVRLEVYAPDGKRVAALENGLRSAGPHQAVWEARQPAGQYLVRLTAGEYRAVRKVMIKK